MTMELFFDTETSGFISKNLPLDSWDNAYTVQLAAILSTKDTIYQEVNLMIRAESREMNPYAEKVHGISVETSNTGGITELAALKIFALLLNFNPTKICHNIAFDFGHIDAMVARNLKNLNDFTRSRYYLDLPECCTMKESTNYCMIPHKPNKNGVVRSGNKWPTLEELHMFLFNEDFDGAHDALADVKATRRCYYELVERGVV